MNITDQTFVALAGAMAIRQLSLFGVPDSEIVHHKDRVVELVEAAEASIGKQVLKEWSVMDEVVPVEPGEDRPAAKVVLALSIYAEAGCCVAARIWKERLAESN